MTSHELSKEQTYQRVRIIGSVGSGKTTLAKQLSKELGIPFYEVDNIVWERNPRGDRRRTEEEMSELLEEILLQPKWIIEGIHNEPWLQESFIQADQILFLDPPYSIRTYRLIVRFIKQRLGLEQVHYQPTFTIFRKMFRWNRHFEEVGKPRFFKTYSHLQPKIMVLSREMKEFRK